MGLIDLFCAAALVFNGLALQNVLTLAAGYLITKGCVFGLLFGDVVSLIDALCGFYILLTIFNISNVFITIIFVIFLGQKALFSFL